MDDRARVTELLGREPRGPFDVVVRTRSGDPVVIRNAPLLDDGTPMPTRFYLVGSAIVRVADDGHGDAPVATQDGDRRREGLGRLR